MTEPRPTRAPAGRLTRLGVVLEADDRALGLARLCDRAGIGAVWLAHRDGLATGTSGTHVTDLGAAIAASLEKATLGLFTGDDADESAFASSPAMAQLLEADRLATARPMESSGSAMGPGHPRRSVIVATLADVASALAIADDIVLPAWRFVDLETAADEVRSTAADAGRDPASLGVAALIPVSIGRTRAEAVARVDSDPLFTSVGNPAQVGIFGTLEECQDRVIALAHAGFTDLICIVPATLDVQDVIAQLTAITIGTTDVLVPGSLRSPSPPPPDGWGGRSPIPERPRVSDGSRRR